MLGWGAGPWGDTPWGDEADSLGVLHVVEVRPIAENRLRVVFSTAIYFSRLLDSKDGSVAAHYDVQPVNGTIGLDGTTARAVTAVQIETSDGVNVDLILDRPMTPYPAEYTVAVTGVWNDSRTDPIDTAHAMAGTFSVFKLVVQPTANAPTPQIGGDIANPQTLTDSIASGAAKTVNPLLGTFVADATRDYASDSGLTSYRKRCWRRIVTVPGGFAHLGPTYGAGITTYGKQLGTASRRAQLAHAIEQQISEEPETIAVACSVNPVVNRPGLYHVLVVAQTRDGASTRITVPVRG